MTLKEFLEQNDLMRIKVAVFSRRHKLITTFDNFLDKNWSKGKQYLQCKVFDNCTLFEELLPNFKLSYTMIYVRQPNEEEQNELSGD